MTRSLKNEEEFYEPNMITCMMLPLRRTLVRSNLYSSNKKISSMIEKQQLSERDICTKYITPALQKVGWDIDTQILEKVSFTDGRIYVKGKITARKCLVRSY